MGEVRSSWILDISKAEPTEFDDKFYVGCERREI